MGRTSTRLLSSIGNSQLTDKKCQKDTPRNRIPLILTVTMGGLLLQVSISHGNFTATSLAIKSRINDLKEATRCTKMSCKLSFSKNNYNFSKTTFQPFSNFLCSVCSFNLCSLKNNRTHVPVCVNIVCNDGTVTFSRTLVQPSCVIDILLPTGGRSVCTRSVMNFNLASIDLKMRFSVGGVYLSEKKLYLD